MKRVRPHNEMLTEMERLLHQKKAERLKREAELTIGQEDGTFQQRINEISASQVCFNLFQC